MQGIKQLILSLQNLKCGPKVEHADETLGQSIGFGPNVFLLHVVTCSDSVASADPQ